jgi:hypothetical protein
MHLPSLKAPAAPVAAFLGYGAGRGSSGQVFLSHLDAAVSGLGRTPVLAWSAQDVLKNLYAARQASQRRPGSLAASAR